MHNLAKSSSGSTGLDAVLEGGYPKERTTLLHGGTGTGKTILGLQFLICGAQNDEPGILVTFEERAEAIRQNALALGWDLGQMEKEGKLIILDALPDPTAVFSGGFDFSGFFALLDGAARTLKAGRIVIDAVDALLQLLNDPVRERSQIQQLHQWLTDHKHTAILTAKLSDGLPAYPFMEFLNDCVIRLTPLNEDRQRLLSVVKYRGSNFSSGEHPYTITRDGLSLVPLADAQLQYETISEHISSGLSVLDEMMGGGYRRGASIALAGASGTGKTTFACLFAAAAVARGERVLYVNFEESANNMVAMMQSSGLDLEPALKSNHLKISSLMPEAAGSEEHLHYNLTAIREHRPHHLVIDAISSCRRMGSEKAAFSYLLRILNYCRQRGITTLFINQITGFQQVHGIYGIGFSSIIDAMVFLDYVQVGGEVNRTMMILKARGSQHSNQYREFTITGNGIHFEKLYSGRGGMLTGVARIEEEYREELEARQRKQKIEAQRRKVERLRSSLQMDISASESEIEKAAVELDAIETEDRISWEARKKRQSMRTGKNENAPSEDDLQRGGRSGEEG